MGRTLDRFAYAACTLAGAAMLLAGSSLAVEAARSSGRDRVENATDRFSRPYIAYNRRSGAHVFRARNLMPGDTGRRLLVIGNDGGHRVRRIALSQDHVVDTGFGQALRLQLYDRTTNRCLHPAPPARARVRSGPCRGWGSWDARRTLRNLRIEPRWASTWRPGERHVIVVRYALLDSSTNADQGQAASFRLRWRHLS